MDNRQKMGSGRIRKDGGIRRPRFPRIVPAKKARVFARAYNDPNVVRRALK